jgi:type II secretory pathway pseudopilin PulG
MRILVQDRTKAAFTLAEVLAALVFMAIVIPVAVEALRVANRAGQVGLRKAAAARVGERVLNELLVSGQVQRGHSGVTREGDLEYRWNLRTESWSEDAMSLVTVQVFFPVQGLDYDVRLSTLLTNTSQ